MQAVINEKINLNVIDGVGTLIKRLEEADNSEKNTIENKIVAKLFDIGLRYVIPIVLFGVLIVGLI